MVSLAERLAALRELSNTSTKSNDTAHTSLAAYLHLIDKANLQDVYINYCEGAKLIYDWLSPIDLGLDKVPKDFKAPRLIASYEVQHLAQWIAQKEGLYIWDVHKAITYTLLTELTSYGN